MPLMDGLKMKRILKWGALKMAETTVLNGLYSMV